MTISVDDGHPLDQKMAEILRKHGHRATFYWSKTNPKYEVMDETVMLRFVEEYPEMEISQHTYSHQLLTKISRKEWEWEIVAGKMWHHMLFDVTPVGFAYPRGYLSPEIAQFLDEEGYRYARTVTCHNQLPESVKHFEIGGGYHFSHPEADYQNKDKAWGHSWELEKYGLWERFEDWLQTIPRAITNAEYVEHIYR